MTDKTLNNKKHLPPWVLAALCIAAVILLYIFVFPYFDADRISSFLRGAGPAAPYIYILLFTLLPALFFPVAVLALAGGLMFGLLRGSIYTFLGAILNCSLMFVMARRVGRRQIEELISRKLSPVWKRRLDKAAGREGFLLLIILRLIPAVPYNLINYTFGLTEMSFSSYILGSAIGIIPGTLVFINIGDKAVEPGSPSFFIAIGLLLLLLLTTGLLGKKLFPEDRRTDSVLEREPEHEKE